MDLLERTQIPWAQGVSSNPTAPINQIKQVAYSEVDGLC